MAIKYGKVTKFDNYVGEIVSVDSKYMFLDSDIIGKIKEGDIVSFKGEKVKDINRAFFIQGKNHLFDRKSNIPENEISIFDKTK